MSYGKHLTYEQRLKIEALYNICIPVKDIAKAMQLHISTVYRELLRGFYMHLDGATYKEIRRYSAQKAQSRADFEKRGKGAPLKLGNDHAFAAYVEHMVKRGYSPAAVLGTIQNKKLTFRTKVCRATLYNYIYTGVLNISPRHLLRHGKRRMQRKEKPRAARMPRGISITERPPSVLTRRNFGHWELDSVIGTKSAGQTLLCFTERMTRFELIFRAKNKTTAATVSLLDRIERKLGSRVFRQIFKTITVDNGCEFQDFRGMERSCMRLIPRTKIYYCHPYCSSERGSNENQNAFIRRFIKKGTPISRYTDVEIKQTQDFINTYPRALFNWKSSAMLFQNELSKLGIKKFFNFFRIIT